MRLDHGAAETRVEGWIPVDAVVDLWTDDAGASSARRCPDGPRPCSTSTASASAARPGSRSTYAGTRRPPTARGRGRDLDVPHHVRIHLTLGGPQAKAGVYAESVRAAMADLVRAARTGTSPRSGIATGAAATTLALAATRAAELQQTVHLSGDPS